MGADEYLRCGDPPANPHFAPGIRLWFARRGWLMDAGLARRDAEALLANPGIDVDWREVRRVMTRRMGALATRGETGDLARETVPDARDHAPPTPLRAWFVGSRVAGLVRRLVEAVAR